jgi:hypothetical protein
VTGTTKYQQQDDTSHSIRKSPEKRKSDHLNEEYINTITPIVEKNIHNGKLSNKKDMDISPYQKDTSSSNSNSISILNRQKVRDISLQLDTNSNIISNEYIPSPPTTPIAIIRETHIQTLEIESGNDKNKLSAIEKVEVENNVISERWDDLSSINTKFNLKF